MCKVERGARKVKCDMFNVTLSEAMPLVSLKQGDNIFFHIPPLSLGDIAEPQHCVAFSELCLRSLRV